MAQWGAFHHMGGHLSAIAGLAAANGPLQAMPHLALGSQLWRGTHSNANNGTNWPARAISRAVGTPVQAAGDGGSFFSSGRFLTPQRLGAGGSSAFSSRASPQVPSPADPMVEEWVEKGRTARDEEAARISSWPAGDSSSDLIASLPLSASSSHFPPSPFRSSRPSRLSGGFADSVMFGRGLHTSSAAFSLPPTAAAASASYTAPLNESDLIDAMAREHEESSLAQQHTLENDDIANDSDDTTQEDFRILNNSSPNAASQASSIANSLRPPFGVSPQRPLRRSSSPASLLAPRMLSRRGPSMVQALQMPVDEAVGAFTADEAELEALNRLREAELAEVAEDEDAEPAEKKRGPIINELVAFLAGAPAHKRDAIALRLRPHTIEEHFANGLAQNIGGYNELIRVCAAKHLYDVGFQHFEHMKKLGLQPDDRTYTALMSLCGVRTKDAAENARRLAKAYELLDMFHASHGGKITEAFFNNLVHAAGRLSTLKEAQKVVDRMRKAEVPVTQVTYTELINICRRTRTPESFAEAMKIFNAMKEKRGKLEPDTHTYNIMIRTAHAAGDAEMAIGLFDEMRASNYAPDNYTYANLIQACSDNPKYYAQTFEYFTQLMAQSSVKPSTHIYNQLLNACKTNGDVANALSVWALMKDAGLEHNTASYVTMFRTIAASQKTDSVPASTPKKDEHGAALPVKMLSKKERWEQADALLRQMESTKVPVTLATLNGYLSVYASALKLNEVHKKREEVFARYPHLQPDYHTHAMVIEMFVNSHRFDRVQQYIEIMRAAGCPGSRELYNTVLRSLKKPTKNLPEDKILAWGQFVIKCMREGNFVVRPEDERHFHTELALAHARGQREQREREDTLKVGPAGSYTQQQDAMIRPMSSRTGRGRQGHQSQRFEENPRLAEFKQKRQSRAADSKDRAQGFKPDKRREQQEIAGHYYGN